MIKKVIPIFVFVILMGFTAGCITETENPIVGTWIVKNYTNSDGMSYNEIIDIFNADNTGKEEGKVTDGSVTNWDFIWIQKGNTYEAYYSPAMISINKDDLSATLNGEGTDIVDWTIYREDNSRNSLAGKWSTRTEYMFMGQSLKMDAELYSDGNGKVKFSNDAFEMGFDLTWSILGDNMYVIAISHKMIFTMGEDGNLTDNFGYQYKKI